MNKQQAITLASEVFWGLFLIVVASVLFKRFFHDFFFMTWVTFWDCLDLVFLFYFLKLIARETK